MNEFRIVSLCPSTTYTLFDLGLKECIVGRTLFCIHPSETKEIKKIGGTKNPNFEKIKTLKPTHILFNMEENDLQHLDVLRSIAPVIISTPTTIIEMIDAIKHLGLIFKKEDKAQEIVNHIYDEINSINKINFKSFTYIYLIWNNPFFTISNSTFISDVLTLFGGINAFNNQKETRYPEVASEELKSIPYDILFLSSEPFPFKKKHKKEFEKYEKPIYLISGEDTSWHGSFMINGLKKLKIFFQKLQTVIE